jgi:CDGSH-type Zn-finger protein
MEPTKITINDNGSIRVEGNFVITDKSGNAYNLAGRTVISLCRCGLSAKKPFCDGGHKDKFASVCEAYDLPAPANK